MNTFYGNILLFIVGSLIFAFSLIFALRRFSKIDIKKRVKFAFILAFASLLIITVTEFDLGTVGKLIGYSFLLTFPLALLIQKYKDRLNKTSKEVNGLIIVSSMFFWRWIHSVSPVVEYTLGFTVVMVGLFIAFSFNEKELKI